MVHLLLIKYTVKNETKEPSAHIPHRDVLLFQKIIFAKKKAIRKKDNKNIENDYNIKI